MTMDEIMQDWTKEEDYADAKQSNDPVKRRSAFDEGQKQLSVMNGHLAMCKQPWAG